MSPPRPFSGPRRLVAAAWLVACRSPVSAHDGGRHGARRARPPTRRSATWQRPAAPATGSAHTRPDPGGVQPGDALVMFMTWNSATAVTTPPAGWTQLQTRAGNNISGRAWTKVATGADANGRRQRDTAAAAKSVLAVRPTAARGGIAGDGLGHRRLQHRRRPATPRRPSTWPTANSWLLNAWSEKSAIARPGRCPPARPPRTTGAATGSGKISMVVADSAAAVATGNAAGRTATTSTSVGRSASFSVVVSPGLGRRTPRRRRPSPRCALLVCGFDVGHLRTPTVTR